MTCKITRLSPIEVANNAPLPFALKKANLLAREEPEAFWNYDPVRSALPKLLLSASPLFGYAGVALAQGDDEELIRSVGGDCRSGASQAQANMAVARAVVEWRKRTGARGVPLTPAPEPYRLSVDTIQFASATALVLDDQLYVWSFDPRSKHILTTAGRDVISSVLWHTTRVGDLRAANIGLLRAPSVEKATRRVIFDRMIGEPVYSMDQLDAMITETYTVWEVILRARQSGQGRTGSLL